MARKKEGAETAPKKARIRRQAPTREEVQARAYEIYLERQGAPGNPLEDWVRAERELTVRYAKAPARPVRVPRTRRREAA
jgi:hypothetical protein